MVSCGLMKVRSMTPLTFRVGDEFQVVVVATHGVHVFSIVDPEEVSYPPKHLQRITFEFECMHQRMRRGRRTAQRRKGDLLDVAEIFQLQLQLKPRVVAAHRAAHSEHHSCCQCVQLMHTVDHFSFEVLRELLATLCLSQLLDNIQLLHRRAFEFLCIEFTQTFCHHRNLHSCIRC